MTLFAARRRIALLFFLSGFCSLLYQIVWVRLAMAHFGVITPILSVVVSVFMLGLGIGCWAAGRWSRRLDSLNASLRAYATCETVIGMGSVLVPLTFTAGDHWLLHLSSSSSGPFLLLASLFITIALLPWCIAMGATLPLAMTGLQTLKADRSDDFSFLYVANVAGAALGSILSACLLIEIFGFQRTLLIGTLGNLIIALGAFSLARRSIAESVSESAPEPTPPFLKKPILPAEILVMLFITGFVSMALEVIWVRNFTALLGTTIYSFAFILAIYLIATWYGSSQYRRDRKRGLSRFDTCLVTTLPVSCLLPILLNDPRLGAGLFGVFIAVAFFCAAVGYVMPALVDHYSDGDPEKAGLAYSVNIAGSIAGPLLASYLLLPYVGVQIAFVFLSVPIVFMGLRRAGTQTSLWQTLNLLVLGVLFASALLVGRSYEEQYPGGIIRRDATATVISVGQGMDKGLLVNGVGITELTTITKLMAHLPLALCSSPPRSALMICFGMGTTYRSLLSWGIQVTAVELVPSVAAAFGYYHDDARAVMSNPRGEVIIDDGRRFLQRTRDSFDVITLDPPPPLESAGSGLLYSRDFYELAKRRLRPGGILQQWLPGGTADEAAAITRSLTEAFPYVRVFVSIHGGLHFLASQTPIVIPPLSILLRRMPPAARTDLTEWEKVDAATLLQGVLSHEIDTDRLLALRERVMVTDDSPYNEYFLFRRFISAIRK